MPQPAILILILNQLENVDLRADGSLGRHEE